MPADQSVGAVAVENPPGLEPGTYGSVATQTEASGAKENPPKAPPENVVPTRTCRFAANVETIAVPVSVKEEKKEELPAKGRP